MLEAARGVMNIVYLVINSNSDVALVLLPISSGKYHQLCPVLILIRRSVRHGVIATADHQLVLPCRAEFMPLLPPRFAQRRPAERGDASERVGGLSVGGKSTQLLMIRMAFASLGSRFAMGAIHCGMLDMMIRRIHEEFNLPQQQWHFMAPQNVNPAAPAERPIHNLASHHVSAIPGAGARNYRAGNRDFDPEIIADNTDTFLWNTGASSLSTQDILDHQRSFVGASDSGYLQDPLDGMLLQSNGTSGEFGSVSHDNSNGRGNGNGNGNGNGHAQYGRLPIDPEHNHRFGSTQQVYGHTRPGGAGNGESTHRQVTSSAPGMAHVTMTTGDSSTYNIYDDQNER
jgi:hypothetical protein